MTFDPELIHMLTSIMVMTIAFEDDKCTDQSVSTSASAVLLAEALCHQLRVYKASFRCNCLCDRQGLAVLPT